MLDINLSRDSGARSALDIDFVIPGQNKIIFSLRTKLAMGGKVNDRGGFLYNLLSNYTFLKIFIKKDSGRQFLLNGSNL